MDSRRLEVINKEVNALLNEPLKVIWKENTAYPSHFSTGEVSKSLSKETLPFGRHVSTKSHLSSSLLSVEPSLDTFLPALSNPFCNFKSPKERSAPGSHGKHSEP